MVLIYPEFEANTVFSWSQDSNERVTVLCPAMPMVTKCLGRVKREIQDGKTILAWGDRICVQNLRNRLESSGVECYDFVPESVM
jgi:hypothetical protein|tara:strand:- start:115 stop:366 length:252 start_codon:yes stop_codon:yes gene_type:complete